MAVMSRLRTPGRRKAHAALFLVLSLALCLAPCMVGCGESGSEQSSLTTVSSITLSGRVMGGQQPIQSAQIQLYAVGSTGNGSAATPILSDPPSSAANGSFTITTNYACASASDPIYVVASGGNPGLTSGTNNTALVLMAVLGPCSQLESSSGIVLNELTTVASTWALAPFMTSAANVGSSATNLHGIANASLNAQLLASTSTGEAITLPSNLSIETGKLYALANALHPCVVSDGATGCAALFTAATPSSGTAPQNTLAAALNIVQRPGENVAAVFHAINSSPAFPSTLTQPPNDWTMSLTVTGGGLNSPASLDVDATGNVWVANYPGALSAFSPQGTPLSATGYGIGTLSESYGLTIDATGNIWVTNEETPTHSATAGSVSAFLGAGSASAGSLLSGTTYFDDPSIDFPRAVAADTNGNILIADYGNSSATIYNSSGQLVQSGVASGAAALPVAITADASHGFWLANQGDNSVTHISSSGAVLAHTICCDGASAIAVDITGNAWVASYNSSSISEISSTGIILLDSDSSGGIANNDPSGIAIDAAQNVWVSNFRGNTISEIVGSSAPGNPGTALSPSTGYGLDANLVLPFGIAPDASGDIWVSNFGSSSIVMFFGLAAPTATPTIAAPAAP
ncbi:MAG: NHL repeat-containing protein [Acidobacteriaceae bacterium]